MKSLARRTVRFVAREWSTEIARLEKSDPDRRTTVDVDVADVLRQMNSGTSRLRLNQFYVRNHRWIAMLTERNARTATETYDFIETEMPNALFRLNQFQVLESRKDEIVELDGQILDFGVYKGDSTRALAKMFPNRTIHGFDSFEGLPEDWEHALKGDFGEVRGRLPDVPSNVCLYKGWFDDSLPAWLERNGGQNLSLLRVDCDLYSSTKTIFDVLAPIIVPGTWILFDELIGYRGWREHEYKAFMEFIEATGHGFEYIAYGLTYTLVRLKG